MLIDSHCHLDFPDFAADRDAVVERARAAGLRRMITDLDPRGSFWFDQRSSPKPMGKSFARSDTSASRA